MKKPNEQGGHRCITRRGLVRAGLGVAGLGVLAGLGLASNTHDAQAAELDINLDEEASLFCGGNMRVNGCIESEGIAVCLGDFTYDYASARDIMVVRQFSAKVAWGLYSVALPNADCLVVGGSYTHMGRHPLCHTGNVRIGGGINRPNGGEVAIVTEDNCSRWTAAGYSDPDMPTECWLYSYVPADVPNWEPYADAATRRRYQDLQNQATIQSNLGRAQALRARGGKTLRAIDYATYLEDRIQPLSDALYGLDATGDVTFSAVGDFTKPYVNAASVRSTKDMWITLEGDGSSPMQVFHVDAAEIMGALDRLGCSNVSVDMRNVPEDASVVVNVHGDYDQGWRGGLRTRWNGSFCETYVNEGSGTAGFKSFVKAACAVLWNFHDTTRLSFEAADAEVIGQPDSVVNGALFPGSIFVPYGSAGIYACTNGHVACAGDMELYIWEHHNVPWRGLISGFAEAQKKPMRSSWL